MGMNVGSNFIKNLQTNTNNQQNTNLKKTKTAVQNDNQLALNSSTLKPEQGLKFDSNTLFDTSKEMSEANEKKGKTFGECHKEVLDSITADQGELYKDNEQMAVIVLVAAAGKWLWNKITG